MGSSEGRRACTFRVRCSDAEHVYLVGNVSETAKPTVVPLDLGGRCEWTKTLALRPGLYRFRLYVDYGRLLTWLCTSDRPHGLDAVLVVPPATPAAPEGAAAAAADTECVWQSTATRTPLEAPLAQGGPAVARVCVSVGSPAGKEGPWGRDSD